MLYVKWLHTWKCKWDIWILFQSFLFVSLFIWRSSFLFDLQTLKSLLKYLLKWGKKTLEFQESRKFPLLTVGFKNKTKQNFLTSVLKIFISYLSQKFCFKQWWFSQDIVYDFLQDLKLLLLTMYDIIFQNSRIIRFPYICHCIH